MPTKSKSSTKDSSANRGVEAKLFSSTPIPVFLWFFWKNDRAGKCRTVSELGIVLVA